MKLFESKLSSIPQCAVDESLSQLSLTSVARGSESCVNMPDAESSATDGAAVDEAQPVTTLSPQSAVIHAVEDEVEQKLKVKDDPRFVKYFKMLSFGVPAHVVAAALTAETGKSSTLLDDPNGPAPPHE